MHRAILHVDLDAFYASVEQRDDPSLRGRPVIVGGDLRRGVVLAASYEVRPFGVRSAMPMARALRLAPHAVVVPPRFEAYVTASEAVHAIFASVTPLVEPLALDEAFLDVTGSAGLFGHGAAIAARLRARIAAEVGLRASAGIAGVKFVAKIASDLAKPDGQREVLPADTVAFLAALPIHRLWGVGPRTAARMEDFGLYTVGDVAAREAPWLEGHFGSLGRHLHELSRGVDERPVVPDREAKSLGAEDTFAGDLTDPEALAPHLHEQALRVGRRLRRAGRRARAVVLKVKFADFSLVTRRATLPAPTDDGQALYRAVQRLLDGVGTDGGVRLTGVAAIELTGAEGQLALFDADAARRRRLNAALDRIADRFGRGAVLPADLAEFEAGDVDDRGDEARRRVGASRLDAARHRR